MGTIEGALKDIFLKKNESPPLATRLGIGAISGALTTFTVTPCEMLTVLRQRGIQETPSVKTLYRGIGPVLLRQSGLGAGMLVCPSIVFNQCQKLYPTSDKNQTYAMKLSSSFFVGATISSLTQVFEQARMMMQNDLEGTVYKNTKVALQKAPAEMLSERGLSLFAIRLTTIAIATIVLSPAREAYPKLIFNIENRL